MSAKHHTEEFGVETINQVTDQGHPLAEVASRLGVTVHGFYRYIKRYLAPPGSVAS
jgi:transposase